MKINIPSTIDHAFLPRRKTVFYLPKIGKSIGYLSIEEIEREVLKTQDLQDIQALFSEFINHLTVYQGLLSTINNEYTFVINGISNIQKEKDFLKSKIQDLACQNGHKGMLNSLNDRTEKLEQKKIKSQKNISECESIVKEMEKRLVIYIGKLFKEALSNTTDDRQRMLLLFKGRIGFVKDWLLNEGSTWGELLALYQDIERNPRFFKELLSTEEDFVIEKYDSPEVKKAKTEIADQARKSESFKRELDKVKDNIARFHSLIKVQDDKINQLQLLVQQKVKKTHKI